MNKISEYSCTHLFIRLITGIELFKVLQRFVGRFREEEITISQKCYSLFTGQLEDNHSVKSLNKNPLLSNSNNVFDIHARCVTAVTFFKNVFFTAFISTACRKGKPKKRERADETVLMLDFSFSQKV